MRNKFAKVSDPNSFVTDPGSPFHVIYEPKILPNGDLVLVDVGKENIQDFIDSFREQTDMAYILNQLGLGDTSVLTNKVPHFGDFTDMPDTYAEALQMVIDAEKQFNCLPLDVRNSFDNNFRKWFATSGSEEWYKFMDPVIVKDSTVDVKEDKEVTVDE